MSFLPTFRFTGKYRPNLSYIPEKFGEIFPIFRKETACLCWTESTLMDGVSSPHVLPSKLPVSGWLMSYAKRRLMEVDGLQVSEAL